MISGELRELPLSARFHRGEEQAQDGHRQHQLFQCESDSERSLGRTESIRARPERGPTRQRRAVSDQQRGQRPDHQERQRDDDLEQDLDPHLVSPSGWNAEIGRFRRSAPE
jgi:hypothetical protein